MRASVAICTMLWSLCLVWGCPATPAGEPGVEPGVTQKQDGGQEPVAVEPTADEASQDAAKEPTKEPTLDEGKGAAEPVVDRVEPTADEPSPPDVRAEPVPEEVTPEASAEEGTPEAPVKTWKAPSCQQVTGLVSVGLSKDAGKTIIPPVRNWPQGIRYTYGLVALRAPNTLIALYGSDLYRSTDAGCTWKSFATVSYTPMRLTLGANDRVWAWSDNSDALYRIDGNTATKIKSPASNIHGVGTHPTDTKWMRVGGAGGQLFETRDGGGLWRKIGSAAVTTANTITYRVAFNPKDLDNAIAGFSREGFHVTTNGGQTWNKASGLTQALGGGVNAFNAVFSPVNSQTLWAMAIDLSDTSGKAGGKHIYHSVDGGKSFTKVVTNLQANDVYLVNGPNLIAHPTDVNKMHWAFGTCTNQYGTNLYTYDASTKSLSWVNHPFPSFDEVVILPTLPNVYYFGIQTNSSPFCPKQTPNP